VSATASEDSLITLAASLPVARREIDDHIGRREQILYVHTTNLNPGKMHPRAHKRRNGL
jgi:hypothetical protein